MGDSSKVDDLDTENTSSYNMQKFDQHRMSKIVHCSRQMANK